jgi:aspartyl-tRNA(Asn)/glutamyl-tRNA(Gln) amidotransferase subunit A
MDEFGMGSATAHSAHGPCYSPFSPAWRGRARPTPSSSSGGGAAAESSAPSSPGWLVPGGSSGGAAVSVAVGSALAAVGSDTGGSVRQPAAFCGVVGFKPTYGRIPRWGLIPYASSLDTVGLIARTVEDAALLYACAAGADPRDDTSVRAPPPPLEPLLAAVAAARGSGGRASFPHHRPLAGLRVGIPREYLVAEVDAQTAGWWEAGAALLAEAGAEVVEVSLPSTASALPAYYVLAPAEAASNLARYDGVRYGYRAREDAAAGGAPGGGEATGGGPPPPATGGTGALHDLYTRTRSEGFGAEVRRRLLTGTFVLSAGARGDYYDRAVRARECVRADFSRVFRPAPADAQEAVARSPVARANAAGRSGGGSHGVDVLLTPVAPTPPWRQPRPEEGTTLRADDGAGAGSGAGIGADEAAAHRRRRDPLAEYVNDVMTIPASLAHLPAIAVPVGYMRCDGKGEGDGGGGGPGIEVPVGLQLIGRLCDDATVLRVAAVLEAGAGFTLPADVRG